MRKGKAGSGRPENLRIRINNTAEKLKVALKFLNFK
jgi:hypothetical protein